MAASLAPPGAALPLPDASGLSWLAVSPPTAAVPTMMAGAQALSAKVAASRPTSNVFLGMVLRLGC